MKRIFNKIAIFEDKRPELFQNDKDELNCAPLIDDVDVTITGFMQAYGQRIDFDLSPDDESDADLEASLDKEFGIDDGDGEQSPVPPKDNGDVKPKPESVPESVLESVPEPVEV